MISSSPRKPQLTDTSNYNWGKLFNDKGGGRKKKIGGGEGVE